MPESHLRQAATVILRFAIRIAPPDTREWGQAMQVELAYVEGSWSALAWALGGASVMAKHALAALIVPTRGRGVPDGGLFAKSIAVRKAAIFVIMACVLGALLFFAAPPFRQGIRVSFAAWRNVARAYGTFDQSELAALARRAEARHDPEALAFVAVRLWDARESARLAEGAVQLDPHLLWVYAIVAVRHSDLQEIPEWVAKLERWDPQNALFPLITAESADIAFGGEASKLSPEQERRGLGKSLARRRALVAAFAAAKYDDYLDRLAELDRIVVLRYRFDDPRQWLGLWWRDVPTFAYQDTTWFAKSLVQSAHELDVRGDRNGAEEKYWAIARFGQLIDAQAHGDEGHYVGRSLQVIAYRELEELSAQEGKSDPAVLFRYLRQELNPEGKRQAELAQRILGRDIVLRNAEVLQISSLLMMLSTGLIVLAVLVLIPTGRRRKQISVQRTRPIATVVTLAGAVGLLLSSATIYLTYRPYWYILQSSLLNGDRTQTRDLQNFLAATERVPGAHPQHLYDIPVYFWTGVTLLGLFALVLIAMRYIFGRTHAHAP